MDFMYRSFGAAAVILAAFAGMAAVLWGISELIAAIPESYWTKRDGE